VPDDIRHYQVHLLEERKLGVGTVVSYIAALRFFYIKTLKRRNMKEDLPYPHSAKHKRRLPTILTTEEVSRLIDAARNLFHYAMLLTMYSAGPRPSRLSCARCARNTGSCMPNTPWPDQRRYFAIWAVTRIVWPSAITGS
jgi:site-specific recombinase XerD